MAPDVRALLGEPGVGRRRLRTPRTARHLTEEQAGLYALRVPTGGLVYVRASGLCSRSTRTTDAEWGILGTTTVAMTTLILQTHLNGKGTQIPARGAAVLLSTAEVIPWRRDA